jgi:hypothetical protein
LFSEHAPGARRDLQKGWWPCYCNVFYFISVSVYNTHQVLKGLPQGVGGLAVLFYFICFVCNSFYYYFSLFSHHAPGARWVAPRD